MWNVFSIVYLHVVHFSKEGVAKHKLHICIYEALKSRIGSPTDAMSTAITQRMDALCSTYLGDVIQAITFLWFFM